MVEFSRFLLLGLGIGAVYAIAGLAIVLVYRGSGTINFAHGALGLTAAGVFSEARDGIGTAGAFAAGLAAASVLGAVINLGVMTPMRRSSPIARVIATVAVLSLTNELWEHRLGNREFQRLEPMFPSRAVEPIGHSITIGQDRLWVLAVTVVVTVGAWLLYRSTRFGLATTAVAENETAAAALGWSPIRIATANWVLGGLLAGAGGIFLATLTGLSSRTQTLVMIPALASALVGRFSSFPLTLAGGLLVGVLESEAIHYSEPTGLTRGAETAVPFLVIMAVVVARGTALPLRSFLADRLPTVGGGGIRWSVVVPATAALGCSIVFFSDNWANTLITASIWGLVGLSVVVIAGLAGQLSLAQWTLAGVGALFGGRLAGDVWGLPLVTASLIGVALTVPVGLAVSVPALRVRGATLAVVTLALGLVVQATVLLNDRYTGGPIRGTIIPDATFLGVSVDATRHPERYAAVALLYFVCAAMGVANVRRGAMGRRLIAVRDNERAAASLGVSVVATKAYGFGLAAALAGVAGTLLAFRNPRLSFDQFDLFGNIDAILFTTIGGLGWIGGALFAGLATVGGPLQHVTESFGLTGDWYAAVAAAAVLVVIVVSPDGVVPRVVGWLRRARWRPRSGRPASVEVGSGRDEAPRSRVRPRSLVVDDVTVRLGGATVVEHVTFRIRPGEAVGLIGPNGAGKTTLLEAITGMVGYSGRISLDGVPLDGQSPQRRMRAGVTRSFQSLELFEDLSVLGNLAVAADTASRSVFVTDMVHPAPPRLPAAAMAAVREFELASILHRNPGDLSYGQRRMVAVARAVATSPSILLLDEPAAGLDEWSTEELSRLIRTLVDDWGMGVLLVEHDVGMVMKTCDRIVALASGTVIADGTPKQIRSTEAVIASYLGDELPAPEAQSREAGGAAPHGAP